MNGYLIFMSLWLRSGRARPDGYRLCLSDRVQVVLHVGQVRVVVEVPDLLAEQSESGPHAVEVIVKFRLVQAGQRGERHVVGRDEVLPPGDPGEHARAEQDGGHLVRDILHSARDVVLVDAGLEPRVAQLYICGFERLLVVDEQLFRRLDLAQAQAGADEQTAPSLRCWSTALTACPKFVDATRTAWSLAAYSRCHCLSASFAASASQSSYSLIISVTVDILLIFQAPAQVVLGVRHLAERPFENVNAPGGAGGKGRLTPPSRGLLARSLVQPLANEGDPSPITTTVPGFDTKKPMLRSLVTLSYSLGIQRV